MTLNKTDLIVIGQEQDAMARIDGVNIEQITPFKQK